MSAQAITEQPYCLGKVWDGWRHIGCSRKSVRDGFCKQHHPETIAKRRAEQDARYAEQQLASRARMDKEKEQRRRADCYDDLLNALNAALGSGWLSIDHERNRTHEACDIRSMMCKAVDKAEGRS